jgi:hypothetical protein
MNKLLIGLMVLGSFSTFANSSIQDVLLNNQDKVEINGITINKDGSVSIREISVKRGDLTYEIALGTTKDYDSSCRLLGFENSLRGKGLNIGSIKSGLKVILKSDGVYSHIREYDRKVDKITCINKNQLKTVVLFDKTENEDKSSRITNISYLRGDLTYEIALETTKDYDSSCRLLGFENSLRGKGLNSGSIKSGPKVILKSDGAYSHIREYNRKVDKITCFSGFEPSLIVLVSGNRYIRVTH